MTDSIKDLVLVAIREHQPVTGKEIGIAIEMGGYQADTDEERRLFWPRVGAALTALRAAGKIEKVGKKWSVSSGRKQATQRRKLKATMPRWTQDEIDILMEWHERFSPKKTGDDLWTDIAKSHNAVGFGTDRTPDACERKVRDTLKNREDHRPNPSSNGSTVVVLRGLAIDRVKTLDDIGTLANLLAWLEGGK